MTTIAYDHKARQIACDSRAIKNEHVIASDDFDKFKLVDGEMWFFAGEVADQLMLIDYHNGKKIDGEYPDCTAIVACKDGVVRTKGAHNDGVTWSNDMQGNETIGSGRDFALAALDFGRSAMQAIEYTITRDVYTGGKVRVFDAEKMEFIL